MNTTFTTYAEKKAKQFLNLLQGYTKGIRMTAILILLLMGVDNAWAYDWTANHTIYFNMENCTDFGTPYFRIGHSSYNNANPMTLVSGTKYLYQYKQTSKWGEYDAFSVANHYAWTDNNSIYQSGNGITKQTDYQKYASQTTVYLKITGKHNKDGDCQYYYVNSQTNTGGSRVALPSYTVTYSTKGDGTLTVTKYNGSSYTALSSGTAVNPTQIIKIETSVGGEVTVTGAVQIDGGNTYYVTENTTITATFAAPATNFLTVEAGEGIASVTGSTDPVTLNSTYPITATPKTGYTFSTWTANPAGNATFGSATTANTTVTVKNGSVTVTATATENMSTLTTSNSYTEGNPGYAAPTASVNSIGYETTASVIATAAGNGYTFTGWTLTNCTRTDGGADDATSITVRSNGDGAAATVIANYEKIPPTTVYINPKTDWEETLKIICDGEEADMTPVGCDGYYTAEVPGGTTELKFGGNNETTLSLTIPQDDKVLYDMTSTNITKLYLKPNANWKQANARFAAYFFGNGETWVSMTAVSGETDLYEVTIPTSKSYPSVIFCRMNPSSSNNNFNDGVKWNQTGDLTIPTDGTNQYTINDGSWDAGSWHKVWDNSCWTTYEPSNTYTVTLDHQGATTGSESVTATFGEKPSSIDIPERAGYTSNGYYTTASEGTQIIDAEGKWINGTNYVDADGNWISTDCNITFYAQWTEKLSTITIIVSEGGSVKVDGEDFVSGNTVKVGVATSKTITLHPNAGYGIAAFGVDGDAWIAGNGTYTLTAKGSGSTGTLYANFVALEYTITWNPNGGKVDPTTSSYTYNGTTVELPTPTRTGYTFNGWFTEQSGGTQITEIGTNNKPTSDVTYYAQWTANTYTVTLDQTGATTQGTPSVTATYDADMPSATMPTKTGYVFGGYYDQTEGQGTQYYKADGTSARTWNKAENTTLYAYFVTPQIEVTLNGSTFEPGTASVIATATVTPAPADGTTVVCWSLLYSGSENEVAGHEPTPTNGNSVQFSISDLAAGSYTIKAILREGTGCEGTEISSATKTFLITSSHTITIKYTCDGKEIQASTTQEAQVSSATTITAPDIVGYTFSNWEAGDGVTINGNTSNRTITYTAIYDGYLTAKYNVNNNIVYFKNTLGWDNVYVYTFSDNAWWNDDSGVHPATNKLEQGEMIRMGDTDIYYFVLSNPDGDYTQENNANNNYIAFSNIDYRNDNGAFASGQAIYRGDHKNNLTLFIPQAGQTPETYNNTKYYSTGIWMKYNSTESGYQIPSNLPGGDWNTYTDNFTTTNPGGYTFSITKNLAANTEYEFKIRNYVWIHNDWEDNGNGKDNNQWFGNNGNITASVSNWHFHDQNAEKKGYNNTTIKTTAAGEYIFTIDLSQGKVLLSVEYPVSVGDYRVIYKDEATWSQGTTAHDANWYHPSRIIKKNKTNETTKDIISFFISYGNNPTMKFQKVKSITNGNVTWEDAGEARIPDNIKEAGVYNFIVTQTANGESISMEEQAEPYTGNYYIRCDAVGGQWDNYKTNKENRMTYSAFSESEANSFGQKYSHYVTKYCPHSTNIKFTIANDYSPCISDTLVRDFGANSTVNPFGNLDENGTLITDNNNNDKYSANVRFMWNHKTNKISRAYIGRAVTNDFLVIDGNKTLHNSKGTERDTIVFFDTQNWIYEVKMKVQPTTRVKVYAAYPAGVGESKAQYFCGAYNNDAFNDDEDSKLALGGDADDQNYYSIRVLYDFKTNRLLMAWMPSGDTENVDGTKTISADVMLIRDHQNPAQCITFANEDSKLSEVKTVYGSMRFNRWVLNNRGGQNNFDVNSCGGANSYDENITNSNHPVLQPAEQKSQYERALYFISFPFDVNVSDIFGFGTYGQHWIIEYYDGLKRAREGFWIDSDPNWKYVTNPDEFVLEKYKGYILCLNLGKMAYNNTDFWAHNISQVELFFPSTTTMSEIKRTEVTMPALGDEYLCKINRNTPEGDRRVKDSYWRCIGVPSYANYSNILTDGEQQTIQWQTSYTTFPFLYAWNMTDNTLTPQSTTNFNFKTMHAYLVQNGGEIHWSAVSATPNQPSNIVARRQAADEVKNYEWKLTLSRNEQVEDQAFVRLSDNEQITTEFDFNQDLSKEFNYGRSDIYTLIGYEKAAANSLPITETTTLIPLGLSIEYNGDYTIAMPDRMENIGVTLIDTESNTRTNLSAGMEYVVTLNKGDYNNRFFIEISPIQQTPTDIEYVTGDSNSQDSVRKVLIDNILYIVRDGQIFDARGARVK